MDKRNGLTDAGARASETNRVARVAETARLRDPRARVIGTRTVETATRDMRGMERR